MTRQAIRDADMLKLIICVKTVFMVFTTPWFYRTADRRAGYARVDANFRRSRLVGATTGRPRDYDPSGSAGGPCPPLRIFLSGWLQTSGASAS